eukprot:2872562-Alexandrium_andersonii.AAC.1
MQSCASPSQRCPLHRTHVEVGQRRARYAQQLCVVVRRKCREADQNELGWLGMLPSPCRTSVP